ncbi:hypothetical protein VaNZ11_006146 [Volvox africanus]|uniref:U3 small nucleolar RNA-associated protein 22 n=1 Tax=Volvox africanus TaxID=51714 RepID=A0ABQ5S0W0_9CHLO|nr:hypothetical protein VaNZ11_006146 [Volvox africanus]
MAPKRARAASTPVELSDEDPMPSDDELQSQEVEDDTEDDTLGDVEHGEHFYHGSKDGDGDDPSFLLVKEAARRQQPAGPGPMSAAAAVAAPGKHGRVVANTALMLQTETSDAAILQIEANELLSETRVSYSEESGVQAVVGRMKDALLSMPVHQVSMSIAKGFVEELGGSAQDSLTIHPPAHVTVVGSYAMHAVARPDATVDIAIQLPNGLLVPKAHLNHRYHVIRAVYLVAVAQYLREVSYSLFGEQWIEAHHGDPTRPVLVLQPPKAEGYRLRLLPSIALSTFALPRLAPDRNGVRAHCKTPAGKAAAVDGSGFQEVPELNQQQQVLEPTPHYNAGILEEMLLPVHAARLQSVLSTSPRLADGLLLIKVWARQHGLLTTRPRAEATAATPSGSGNNPSTSASMGFGAAVGGCLDGCILAMLVMLLVEKNKMASSMTALQVFRAALQLLADGPSWSKGLSLGRQVDGLEGKVQHIAPPAMQVFKANFQVVFLDFTGWLNVAAYMTRGSLAHAQLVARRTLDLLTAPADPDEAFAAVFLTTANPAAAFDYHWRISLPAGALWPVVKAGDGAKGLQQSEEKHSGLIAPAAQIATVQNLAEGSDRGLLLRDRMMWRQQEAEIEKIVRQALSDRAKVVRVLQRPLPPMLPPEALSGGLLSWMGMSPSRAALNVADEDADDAKDAVATPRTSLVSSSVWVGAVLDPLLACRLVDIGPSADDGPAAAQFRQFWGRRAELRRWQDGMITETAVWEVAPHLRHIIPDIIVRHVVERHLPAESDVAGAAGCLDWALCSRALPPGADLSAMRAAEAAVDKLTKQLRALDQLALKVVGVQPLSAVARGTAPLPPPPHPLAGGSMAAVVGYSGGGSGVSGAIPRCLDPMEVLVTLENSGRWPDDPAAFRKMKAALGIQLSNALSLSYGHHVVTSEEAVDVLMDGFAFRLVLYSGRDEAMLARASAGAAVPVVASSESSLGSGALSPEESPLLLSWHHGLVSLVAGSNSAFAPAARLAARWVAAHMMSNHLNPQTIELLVAAAFSGAGSSVAPPPGSRITGFLRFLQLLSRWPWSLKPLVVDPSGELKEADRRLICARFEAQKSTGEAPAMYVCTPRDRESRHWTRKGPGDSALQRLTVLAARSATLLQLLLQPPANRTCGISSSTWCNTSASHNLDPSTPSGLAPEWRGLFATPAVDFDAFLLLRKEALPHADMAILPNPHNSQSSRPTHGKRTHRRYRPRRGKGRHVEERAVALAALLLPPGAAVQDLLYGGGACGSGSVVQQLDAPPMGPDALSDALEDVGPMQPPPKRARAFLRCFPDKVVVAKGIAKLQPELLIGFDPVGRLISELSIHFGHLAMFCVDGLGGRLVGVRWRPDAFLPQPLRLSSAHTALPLLLTDAAVTGDGADSAKKRGMGLCVPNVFAVLQESKEMGLGLVEDWLIPPSGVRARAWW